MTTRRERARRSAALTGGALAFGLLLATPAANAAAEPRALTAAGVRAATTSVGEHASTPRPRNTPSLPRWGWPIGPPLKISRPFEAPATPYASGHRGIDLEARAGDPVFAPADGTVHFSGYVVDRPVLTLAHGEFLASFEPVESTLSIGEEVAAGQTVGIVSTGTHCSSCLHFGVRYRGDYISPLLLVGDLPRAVLLPLER